MIAEIRTTVELLNGLKELLSSNSDKEENSLSKELLFRNYYSEIFYNKKIFETINFKSGLNQKPLESIKEIAPLLKNEYGKVIVASLGKFKDDIRTIQEQSEIEDKEDKTERSLVHNVIFTVNRIEVLKKLAVINNGRYIKKINVVARLKNINKDTSKLCKAFNESFENVINNIIV